MFKFQLTTTFLGYVGAIYIIAEIFWYSSIIPAPLLLKLSKHISENIYFFNIQRSHKGQSTEGSTSKEALGKTGDAERERKVTNSVSPWKPWAHCRWTQEAVRFVPEKPQGLGNCRIGYLGMQGWMWTKHRKNWIKSFLRSSQTLRFSNPTHE